MRTKPSAKQIQEKRFESKMNIFAQNRLFNMEMIRQNPFQEQSKHNQELIKRKIELEKTCCQMDIEEAIELEELIKKERKNKEYG